MWVLGELTNSAVFMLAALAWFSGGRCKSWSRQACQCSSADHYMYICPIETPFKIKCDPNRTCDVLLTNNAF
jgi:hypothetical protein